MKPSHLDYLCQIISMKNNNLEGTIFSYQSTLKVEVPNGGHVRLPQRASSRLFWHLTFFKWPKIWHKGASSHAKWCYHCVFPMWFEIFQNFMFNSKTVFHSSSMHLPKKPWTNLASTWCCDATWHQRPYQIFGTT
jgi:hypothetical protein